MLGICLPSFVLGPMLILIFGIWFDMLPVSDERTSNQASNGRAEEAHDRCDATSQGMHNDDPWGAQTLSFCGTDVVLGQNFEHTATGNARNVRRVR